jgi:hypothetical protein
VDELEFSVFAFGGGYRSLRLCEASALLQVDHQRDGKPLGSVNSKRNYAITQRLDTAPMFRNPLCGLRESSLRKKTR